MVLSRNGSRDDRRRRVLREDAQAEPAPSPQETPPVKRKPKAEESAPLVTRYSLASLADGQPRLSDLLPRRRLTLWLWAVAMALAIAALAALDVYHVAWKARFPQVDWSVLDLSAKGSLGRWFSSVVLGWAAFSAVMIYCIRRHRADDYRGGYRLWLWAAAALALASADASTSLHATLGGLITTLLNAPRYGALVGLGFVAAIAGAIGLRMVWEMKPSRGSLVLSTAAGACYLAAVAKAAGFFDAALAWVPAAAAAALSGHALILLTIGVFGRHVHSEAFGSEAFGQAEQRRRKSKTRKASESASKKRSPKVEAKTDLDAKEDGAKPKPSAPGAANTEKRPAEPAKKPLDAKPSPVAAPMVKNAAKPTPDADDDSDEENAEPSSRPSKAERRKLRKQHRQKAA